MGIALNISLISSLGGAFPTLRHSTSDHPQLHQPLCWSVGTPREGTGQPTRRLAIALAEPSPSCPLITQHTPAVKARRRALWCLPNQ